MSARVSLDDFACAAPVAAAALAAPSLEDFSVASVAITSAPALALVVTPPADLAAVPAIPVVIAAPIEIRPDFTFSKGPLAKSGCAAWLQPGVPWYSGDNRYMAGGRASHEDMRDITRAAVLALALPPLPADAKRAAMIVHATAWLLEKGIFRHKKSGVGDSIVGGGPIEALFGLRAEVALAYDVATRTGRVLEDGAEFHPGGWDVRWYADPAKRAAYIGPGGAIHATEICGRVDLMCTGFDDRGTFGWVKDYKFHYGPTAKDAQGQLAFCALALQTAYDLERVEASALHVWEDRDVAEEHLCSDDGATELGRADIAKIAAWVDTLARPAANDPVPHEGPHCADRDCPAVASCAVAGEIVAQVLPAETLVRRRIAEPLVTNEDAAWALVAADLLVEVGEQLKARARMYADENEGIRQSDGRLYSAKEVVTEKPDLSAPRAIETLRELGLEKAILSSTTWTEIKKHGGAPAEKRAREALRMVDAVKISSSPRYEARMPKPVGAS